MQFIQVDHHIFETSNLVIEQVNIAAEDDKVEYCINFSNGRIIYHKFYATESLRHVAFERLIEKLCCTPKGFIL